MEQLLVGVAREVITPELGTMLMGYSARPALSINDDLHVTAFAFQTGDTKALLLSADLCNIYYSGEKIRSVIAEAADVPPEHIIISCTHTHSGPETYPNEVCAPYMEGIFIPQAAKAAVAAMQARKPARMGVGTTYSEVAVNRRQIKEDGTVILGQNPRGSWDPTMTVVSFCEPDGTPIGNIIQYGCHNTASGKNDEVTRDWCGVAIDRLQKQSGGITAFINGCGGDCGPRLPNGGTTGNLEMAMELGGKAASDAVRAWRSIGEWREVSLKVLRGELRLPLQDIGTAEELTAKMKAMGDPEALDPAGRYTYDRLAKQIRYIKNQEGPLDFRIIPRTLIALGPVAILPLPFEPFSMITLRIKDASPFAHTLIPGYSNGAMSYMPSIDQIARGGYEIGTYRVGNLIPFAEDSEQYLVTDGLKLLRELYQQ